MESDLMIQATSIGSHIIELTMLLPKYQFDA